MFEMFAQNEWAGVLGWTLLHSLWQGSALALLLALVLAADKRPQIRYPAACWAAVGLFACFILTFVWVAADIAPHAGLSQPVTLPLWRASGPGDSGWRWVDLSALAPWLGAVWICGVVFCYLRFSLGVLSLRRLRQQGVCALPAHWQQTLLRFSASLRITRPVQVLESALAHAPIVIGHLRPLILLPCGLLTNLPAGQLEAILLHELAHIRRNDFLLNAIQNLLDGFFFYHPAFWWISHVIRAEREKCCDDLAVAACGNAHRYAAALAALEDFRWSQTEPALAAKGGSLMKRIQRVLHPKLNRTSWLPIATAAIFLTLLAASLGAWQSKPNPANSYGQWLNEDVVYIIDDAERAAFLKLPSAEERQQFVEQFWERRNPSPGQAENKFKEEHYRRIAFANSRFGAPATPGWKTDRGHMYILYGPPDEIDSHRSAGQPYETWGYRNIDHTGAMSYFRFVDARSTGDFRLAPAGQ